MDLIWHVTRASDWHVAQDNGEYTVSTKGISLAQQGFIHASLAHQVARVANVVHVDDNDLIVLGIDVARLGAPVKYEAPPDEDEEFPHIYGPLNLNAVVSVQPLLRGKDGRFSFAAENVG
ncbi:DUF952 domain-containing protein [Haloglycomyces albus]|uniref:DUF952 domain-containing protein n=1 Tax=Haloglycomyces albus TaxID=526067 RepID=UPI00054D3C7B|nr:DUF952 domain-containing protein [Haloglycomyces albus]